MANPNLLSLTTVSGKTAVQAVTTSATAIVTNSAASGKLIRVKALYVSNVDGTNTATVNADVYRSTTAYHLAKTITIPADATLDIITKDVYLEEGDSLRLTASDSSDLEAICSYEEIS
jgi:hypothetical protein